MPLNVSKCVELIMKQWNWAVWIENDTRYPLLSTIWNVVRAQSLVRHRQVLSTMDTLLYKNPKIPAKQEFVPKCTNTKFHSPEPLAKRLPFHAQMNISLTVHSYSSAHGWKSHRLMVNTISHRFICGNYGSLHHEIICEPINLWHALPLKDSPGSGVKRGCTASAAQKTGLSKRNGTDFSRAMKYQSNLPSSYSSKANARAATDMSWEQGACDWHCSEPKYY